MATNASPMLPLVWAERPMTLMDVVVDGILPCIVKLHSENRVSDPTKSVGGSSLHNPMLLYKEAKTVRIVAKNVTSLEPIGNKIEEAKYKDGKTVVVIPMGYVGWFRVLDEGTVPLITMANVAREMPISYLSVKPMMGFLASEDQTKNADDKLYERVQVPSGLFIVKTVLEDYVRYTIKTTQKRKLLICLVCIAEDGSEYLFPLETEGEFYVTEAKKSKSSNSKTPRTMMNAHAYLLKDLVEMGAFTKPLLLRLLIGDPPSKPCGFTGVIRVVDLIKDRTIIASVLDGSRKLLELPIMPYPFFIQSTNGSDLLKDGSLQQEIAFMDGAADAYTKEIKVREVFSIDPKKKK